MSTMRRTFGVCLLVWAAIIGIAVTGFKPKGFVVDQYFAVALDYSGPRAVTGVNTFGPTDKAEACMHAAANIVAQANQADPKGTVTMATCLRVKFTGPLNKHGAVVTQSFNGQPAGVILIGALYGSKGQYEGMQPLHGVPDVATCQKQAQDLIDTAQHDGKVPAGDSLLIYCLPVPVLPMPESAPSQDGSV